MHDIFKSCSGSFRYCKQSAFVCRTLEGKAIKGQQWRKTETNSPFLCTCSSPVSPRQISAIHQPGHRICSYLHITNLLLQKHYQWTANSVEYIAFKIQHTTVSPCIRMDGNGTIACYIKLKNCWSDWLREKNTSNCHSFLDLNTKIQNDSIIVDYWRYIIIITILVYTFLKVK